MITDWINENLTFFAIVFSLLFILLLLSIFRKRIVSKFSSFWKIISRTILNNRILIISLLALVTYFFSTNWNNIRFTYTEANLLPDTHPENIKYKRFTEKFGEEGNLVVISVKDSSLFQLDKLNAWNSLSQSFKNYDEVSTVISFGDLQKLKRIKKKNAFTLNHFLMTPSKTISNLKY